MSLCRKVCATTLVKVLSLTSVATLVRMCTGLISVKVVAAVVGPAGVVLLGQLNNFVNIAQTLAGGGICSGITKYVAEHKDDKSRLLVYLAAALKITLISSVVCGVIVILLAPYLSRYVMLDERYSYVFVILGVTLTLYALNAALLAVVNGFKDWRKYVSVNIANSLVGAVFTVALALIFGLGGALVAAVTYQSVVFAISVYMLRKRVWLKLLSWRVKISGAIVRQFGGYAVMSLVTAVSVPLVQMLLRGYVMTDISESQAGIWEGMQKISTIYLMVVTASLSAYYLPRLSEIADTVVLRREILKAYALILPVLIVGFTIIYFLRFFIIRMLFTPEFGQMQELFFWQMSGDLIRIASWMLAFLMVAKAMTITYIITEIASSMCFLVLGYVFIQHSGIVGLVQANLINYAIYFVVMILIFRNILFFKSKNNG